jgi:sialic acid synthase SpsE
MVFVTAEFGPTWMGDYHLLYKMMKTCKDAGFDAVKLQSFNKSHLNSRYWRIKGAVTHYNVNEVDSIAKEVGIQWYCMPTMVEDIDWLAPYVKMWKIRYRDQDNIPLIKKVLEQKQTTFISTNHPEKWKFEKHVYPMYCINKYPTPADEVDFEKMKDFKGYSCHTPDVVHVMLSINTGIKFLEVHISPDKSDPLVVDNPVSFGLNDLHSLIERVRIWQKQV